MNLNLSNLQRKGGLSTHNIALEHSDGAQLQFSAQAAADLDQLEAEIIEWVDI